MVRLFFHLWNICGTNNECLICEVGKTELRSITDNKDLFLNASFGEIPEDRLFIEQWTLFICLLKTDLQDWEGGQQSAKAKVEFWHFCLRVSDWDLSNNAGISLPLRERGRGEAGAGMGCQCNTSHISQIGCTAVLHYSTFYFPSHCSLREDFWLDREQDVCFTASCISLLYKGTF